MENFGGFTLREKFGITKAVQEVVVDLTAKVEQEVLELIALGLQAVKEANETIDSLVAENEVLRYELAEARKNLAAAQEEVEMFEQAATDELDYGYKRSAIIAMVNSVQESVNQDAPLVEAVKGVHKILVCGADIVDGLAEAVMLTLFILAVFDGAIELVDGSTYVSDVGDVYDVDEVMSAFEQIITGLE